MILKLYANKHDLVKFLNKETTWISAATTKTNDNEAEISVDTNDFKVIDSRGVDRNSVVLEHKRQILHDDAPPGYREA